MDILLLIKDGIFAAIAAIGFSSISNPDRKVYPAAALIAALGHMTRYYLMNTMDFHLAGAGFIAALVIGIVSLPAARLTRNPAECISFPALLPMVPGMYAYRSVQSVVECLLAGSEDSFMHYLYLLRFNWMTCIITIVAMVVGVTLPIFIFKKLSFRVTK